MPGPHWSKWSHVTGNINDCFQPLNCWPVNSCSIRSLIDHLWIFGFGYASGNKSSVWAQIQPYIFVQYFVWTTLLPWSDSWKPKHDLFVLSFCNVSSTRVRFLWHSRLDNITWRTPRTCSMLQRLRYNYHTDTCQIRRWVRWCHSVITCSFYVLFL